MDAMDQLSENPDDNQAWMAEDSRHAYFMQQALAMVGGPHDT